MFFSGITSLGLGLISLTLLTENVLVNIDKSRTGKSLNRLCIVWQSTVYERFLDEEKFHFVGVFRLRCD